MCIYTYNFRKSIDIDEQLLSGFLSAIGSFAQQTFQTGLQTINIENGQKMNFYVEKQTKLIFVAISDTRDNNSLLEHLLAEIALKFNHEMEQHLNSTERGCLDNYKKFNNTIITVVKGRDKDRSRKTMLEGLFTGTVILIMIFYAFSPLFIQFMGNLIIYISLIILFISIGLLSSTFVSGYFAGNPKMGTTNGFIFFALVLIVVSFFYPYSFYMWIIASPFAIIICAAAGFYGGLMCDKRKLYPLKEQ